MALSADLAHGGTCDKIRLSHRRGATPGDSLGEAMCTPTTCARCSPAKLEYVSIIRMACALAARTAATVFQGYPRKDGRVGVRNELWILPTVGCVQRRGPGTGASRPGVGGRRGVEGVHAFTASLWLLPDGRGSGAIPADMLADLACTSQRGGRAGAGAGLRKQRRGPDPSASWTNTDA